MRNWANTRIVVTRDGIRTIIARDTLRQAWHDARRDVYHNGGTISAHTIEQIPVHDQRLEFFVSAVHERGRYVLVRGPYSRHIDALADVVPTRIRHTRGIDTDVSERWVWGTCSRPRGTTSASAVVEHINTDCQEKI